MSRKERGPVAGEVPLLQYLLVLDTLPGQDGDNRLRFSYKNASTRRIVA
jgi:hypothetical protein